MNILGLIPARGGSKGILGKNLVELAGKPLLQYSIDAARGSEKLSRLLLSTDDMDIAAYWRGQGLELPFMRPADLGADDTPMLPVLTHAVNWLAENEGWQTDILILLQPTSPLRRAEHIDAAIDLVWKFDADTVVSVMEVPHRFNPVSVMRVDEKGALHPHHDEGQMILRRQDKPRVLARNGPAILAIRRETLDSGRLYGDHIRPLLMSEAESVDIDGPDDLALATFYLKRQTGTSDDND